MKLNEQVRNYFAEMGKRGGSATSAAKARAARRNAKLGGRPRKNTKLKK